MSAEDYLALINAIIDRYGKAIECSSTDEARSTAHESALAELSALSPKVNRGDAERWLRAKGWPK